MITIKDPVHYSIIKFDEMAFIPQIMNDLRIWRSELKEKKDPNQYSKILLRMTLSSPKIYETPNMTLLVPSAQIEKILEICEYWIVVLDKLLTAYVNDNYKNMMVDE